MPLSQATYWVAHDTQSLSYNRPPAFLHAPSVSVAVSDPERSETTRATGKSGRIVANLARFAKSGKTHSV